MNLVSLRAPQAGLAMTGKQQLPITSNDIKIRTESGDFCDICPAPSQPVLIYLCTMKSAQQLYIVQLIWTFMDFQEIPKEPVLFNQIGTWGSIIFIE